MEQKYNVYIVGHGGKAVACIGKDIRKSKVEMRLLSGLSRIDRDNFFVVDEEVGSEADKAFALQTN